MTPPPPPVDDGELPQPPVGVATPPSGCTGTAQLLGPDPNDRAFEIVCPIEVTNLSVGISGNVILGDDPPPGGTCVIIEDIVTGATYNCTGNMGKTAVFGLFFNSNPSGQTAIYDVNSGQHSGTIEIP